MAGSRLERVGTIFSRATGLIRSGAVSYEDRPLWFDVYKAIPPNVPPKFDRVVSDEPVKNIFYPEDKIRAKFHKYLGKNQHRYDLADTKFSSTTKRVIDLCEKFQKEKEMDLEEAFENAVAVLKSEGLLQQRRKRQQPETPESVMAEFLEARRKNSEKPEIKMVNMTDIFKKD